MRKEELIEAIQEQLPDGAEVSGFFCLIHYTKSNEDLDGMAEVVKISSDTLGMMLTKILSENSVIKEVTRAALLAAENVPGPELNN